MMPLGGSAHLFTAVIGAIVLSCANPAFSLPVQRDGNATRSPNLPDPNQQTSRGSSIGYRVFPRTDENVAGTQDTGTWSAQESMRATNDQEYRNQIEKALLESINSINRPENFVDDDLSVDEVMQMFEKLKETSSNANGEQSDSVSNQPEAVTASPDGVLVDEIESTTLPPCPICLEDLSAESRSIKLKCGHEYHKPCLRGWADSPNFDAQNIRRCPMCRKAICSEDYRKICSY